MALSNRTLLAAVIAAGALGLGALYITRSSGPTDTPTWWEMRKARIAREAREAEQAAEIERLRIAYKPREAALLTQADQLIGESKWQEAAELLKPWAAVASAELKGRLNFAIKQIPAPAPAPKPIKPAARATAATSDRPAPVSDAQCRADPNCWIPRHELRLASACRPAVERLAKWDFEWTDGWLESKFSTFRLVPSRPGSILATGDKIKMQNGFGAWQRVSYICVYDPATGQAEAAAE